MDQFQRELAELQRIASTGGQYSPGQEQSAQNSLSSVPGFEGYSHQQVMEMYQRLMKGEIPPELAQYTDQYTDKDGKPIVDPEGGAIVQPNAGFVVKTKDQNGNKVFINMASHELVDEFEEKHIPQGDREKFGGSETGIRIPLSLGTVREDFDKKGEAAQVYDVIWNPKTVERCKTDAPFRQIVVELAFNHIAQKHNHNLDLRFTIPKMKYKGKTIQFQRIRAKKGPKIQQMASEMSDEDRKSLEAKGLEQTKKGIIQEISEKEPDWQIYCVQRENSEIYESKFWDGLIKNMLKMSEEVGVGDLQDRYNTLSEKFKLPTQEGIIEEFDGLNHEEATDYVMVVSLPVIMRGHSIQLRLSPDLLTLRVPTLYSLKLGFPSRIEIEEGSYASYFECKLRKLIIVMKVYKEKKQEEEVEDKQEEVGSKVIEIVDTKKLENDMLFDVI